MNDILEKEREILQEKKELIRDTIEVKKENLKSIEEKLTNLKKSSKGYSVEKEVVSKTEEILKRDIEGYEEVREEPYFGRVDFREYRSLGESIYIGKKGITKKDNSDEIVVDWRAPVADLYYSGTGGKASYKAPNGIIEGELSLKRKFLYNDGDIDRVFDEGLNELMINGGEGTELVDEFLKVNLEESRGKKLKEVVATIQKEQNDIIRWPKNLPIIVQGSAGSGKTTIALHRLAYLIYRYRDTIKGEDILVLAPNKLFLDYISETLPSLGANSVNQKTFEDLVLEKVKVKGKIYNKDEKLKSILEEEDEKKKKLIINSSRLKGTLAYRTMLKRCIALIENREVDIDDIKVYDEILFPRREIAKLYKKDLSNYPINKRKDEIKRYLNLKLKAKINIALENVDKRYDEKVKILKSEITDEIERRQYLIKIYDERDELKKNIKKDAKKEMNKYFKEWANIESKDIYYEFFNDEELFSLATDNKIPKELEEFIKEEYNSNKDRNIIDEDDLSALLYIKMLLEGIEEEEKFQHIVVDEAQDYSPFQVYLVNKLSRGNSLTLVGDLAQGIYYYKGIKVWEDITEGLFNGEATYMQLTQSYRSTVEIIDFAKKALESQNLGLKNALPVLRHGEKPRVIEVDDTYVDAICSIVDEVKMKNKRTVAIITKNIAEAKEVYKALKNNKKYKFALIEGKESEVDNDLIILPSYITKGLEFDATIIFDPSEDSYKNNILDERLLYVSLTRALHLEYIIKINKLSDLILY